MDGKQPYTSCISRGLDPASLVRISDGRYSRDQVSI